MCVVTTAEYDLLYTIDLDGSFRPNLATAPTVSSLVASDNNMHLTFLDPSKCVDNTVGCYSYCHDTCFRSMRYYVKGTGQESYKLKVCSRSDYSRCSLFKGGRRGDVGSHEFTAHLPSGQLYDAVFLDGDGNEITPSKVTEVVEKTFCTNGIFEVLLLKNMGVAPRPVGTPVQVPTPVRQPAPVPTPIKAPIRPPVPVLTPTKAPVRSPLPLSTPVRVPIRPPASAPAPVAAPIRPPVTAPVIPPVQGPVTIQISSPVLAPAKRKSIFSSLFSMLFPWLKRS